MIITEMNLNDIPQVAYIEEQCFSHPWSEKSITESFNSDCNHFFVAKENDKLIGYIGVTIVIDQGFILNVAVLPKCRGYGVGKMLVDKVINLGREFSLDFVTLEVRPSNTTAVNLYSQCGFVEVGKRKNYYSTPTEDALLLTKYYNSEKE